MNFIIDIRFELKYFVIFFVLIGFVGSAFALDNETLHPAEISLEEHYEIEILGLKDEYMIGEEYSFYFVISGYGHSCANHQASYPDENGNIIHIGAEVLCAPEKSMHEFNFNPLEGKRTLGNTGIKKPGTYTITVTFEKPSKYYPTTISKEFRVVESITENFNKLSPLKQIKAGIAIEEIQCKDSLVLVTKYDGSPACVKSVTKQHLMDRGWAEPVSFDKIKSNPELMKQNIIRTEDGRISLYPENTCASISLDLPTKNEIQRYKNDERGLNESNTLQITSSDFNEIPIIEELIYAVNTIEFPYNKYSSAYLDGLTFVEYEFFLMEKAIEKYGGSQNDYFIKLDKDYEERFANPAKQGFTNTFEAPLIVYNNQTYSVGGTIFWVSDEHEPMRMNVYPDEIKEDEKFIVLTDEDMKSVPKIKQAIEDIGTTQESINGRKGLPEDQWNEYREWFEQKSQEQLNTDRFRLVEYDGHLYSVAFGIC